jgi:hypothetical protein
MKKIFETAPLALQKSRMPEMKCTPFDKLRGEAIVVYADPLTTQLMLHPRLSRRVNNMTFFGFLDITHSGRQNISQQKPQAMATIAFEILLSFCLCDTGESLRENPPNPPHRISARRNRRCVRESFETLTAHYTCCLRAQPPGSFGRAK